MSSAVLNNVSSVAGLSIQSTITRTGDGQIGLDPTLPAAVAGTLDQYSTSQGDVTLVAGHGITTGDYVHLIWATGARYNIEVTADAATEITVSGGTGDNLPAGAATDVTVAKRVTINADFDGDDLLVLMAQATYAAYVQFVAADTTVLLTLDLAAAEDWRWVSDSGTTTPITGDPVDYIYGANLDTTGDSTLKVGVLYDA